jgi:hypothetical protein
MLQKEENWGRWQRCGACFKPGATRQRRGGQRWMPHNEWRGGGAGTWSSSGPHGRGSRGPTAAGARA